MKKRQFNEEQFMGIWVRFGIWGFSFGEREGMKIFQQKRDFDDENRTSDGFVFFVDPASHYHGAAGVKKKFKKTAGKVYFFRCS